MANDPLPPLVLASGEIVPDLLRQSRAIRRRAMSVFAKLEEDHQRETGKSKLEAWAGSNDTNYKDFLTFLTRVLPKEPEESSQASVEDMLDQLDKRAANAKIIDGGSLSPGPTAPSSSSEPSSSE